MQMEILELKNLVTRMKVSMDVDNRGIGRTR